MVLSTVNQDTFEALVQCGSCLSHFTRFILCSQSCILYKVQGAFDLFHLTPAEWRAH